MSDLTRAAEALRASVAALPGWLSEDPWLAGQIEATAIINPDGWVLWRPYVSHVTNENVAMVDHIARTASPDVVAALADLLIVVGRADYDNPSSTIEHIEDAAATLAAAVLREVAP